jgi:8-oxo-dGTP pyrophosphatase MutT (NUDIX family)
MQTDDYEVHAAGAAVWRLGPHDQVEWAVIHRPRYDDWTLPKGKLDPGEDFETAAVREIQEEISISGTLGAELPPTTYTDHKGRSKVVRYWLMEAPADAPFEANDEVDRVDWLPGDGAVHALTYDRDRTVLQAAIDAQGAA